MNSVILLPIKYLLMAALLLSCSARQQGLQEDMPTSFVVVHHSELNIPDHATYQWSEGFTRQAEKSRIKNVDMWGLLKQSIEQEMQRKGYRQVVEVEQADLNISFIAALESSLGDEQIAKQYGLVPGLMVNNIDTERYQKGTLIFDVVNPHTKQLAWRTAGQALASMADIPLLERESRIDVFVTKLLAFLPEM